MLFTLKESCKVAYNEKADLENTDRSAVNVLTCLTGELMQGV